MSYKTLYATAGGEMLYAFSHAYGRAVFVEGGDDRRPLTHKQARAQFTKAQIQTAQDALKAQVQQPTIKTLTGQEITND